MKIRHLFAAVALATASVAASAAEVSALLYGTSYHFTSGMKYAPGYNGTNPGIGLEAASDGWLIGAGTYYDSYRKQAYMAYGGYRWEFPITGHWKATAALKVGYLNGSGHHGIAALPTVGIGYRNVSVEMTVLPPNVNGPVGVAAFWLRYQF